MFSAFMVILAVASVFFIPLYVGVRVAVERQENNPDLLYISTLSPTRIIRGKFLCGAYMALLFFCACMPFMALTNLLRGVDLPTVFFILFYLFMVVCAANQIAICFACVPASRPFKILFALGGFIASFWIVIPLILVSFRFMGSGIGSMMGEHNFWIGVLTAVVVSSAVIGLFFVLSVALISPPSANRALPVRIYMTVIWLVGGLLNLGWVVQMGEARLMDVWGYSTFAAMIFSLVVAISNSDQLSHRVQRAIPRSRLKRMLSFMFFNGAAGGLIWVAAILAATFVVTKEVIILFPKLSTGPTEGRHWFVTTTAYAFDYALTALFVHRRFLSRLPPKITGLLAALLAGAWAIAPSIVLFFLNQLSWKSIEGLQLGNVFNVFSLLNEGQLLYHQWFAFGWLFVATAINMKWFLRQVKSFQPPDRTQTPPLINEISPAA